MFSYENGSLLAASLPVWSGFGVTVCLEGETPKRLVYQSYEQMNEAEYILHFEDDLEPTLVSVNLTLRCYEDVVLGFVSGKVRSEHSFVSRKSFSAIRSISIAVDQMEEVRGLLANHQHSDWWTRPHFDTDLAKLPARTISLLWQTRTSFFRLLPVCGPVFRTDLEGGEGKGFSIVMSSYQGGLQRNEALAFVLGGGNDPFSLADRTTDAALKELDYPTLPRHDKKYPEVLDYLGWCSWDAFYQKVDKQGVLAKAEEFNRLGVPVRWMMIDDGWLTTSEGKLQAFDADPEKFGDGLAATVTLLKEQYGVRWVGVWHTLVGYWEGIHPESTLAKSLSSNLYTTADGGLIPYPDPALGFGFWNAWHGYLRRQGIDFVKVDSQAAINNFLQYERSVGAAASAAHQAIEASVALHFDGAMINCMGLAAENIWHRPKSAVSRNSDDFFPKIRHGFREHALQNAYNSYYHGSFYWGDWDMFWTINHDNLQNSVLRAISGGPVYISDPLDQTDPLRLLPLVYGDGKLIRCERTAVPTVDCLLKDPVTEHVPLKLWNYAGEAGIVAAFHIGDEDRVLSGVISAADVPGLSDRRVVLYEHFSQECKVLGVGESFSFVLQPEQCKLFVIAPKKSAVTPLGLANKYASTHAIVKHESRRNCELIRIREGGRFIFHFEAVLVLVLVNREAAQAVSLGNGFYEVDCSDQLQEVEIEIVH